MQFFQSLFSPDAWQLLGRFHVLIIHFPLALLITAALIEFVALLRRKTAPAPAAFACILLGTLSAVAAATTGWFHANYTRFPDQANALFYHRWLGIATAALSLILLLFYYHGKNGTRADFRYYQCVAFLTAIAVGITGHFGGTLTHGPDYLTITHTQKPNDQTPTTSPATTTSAVSYAQIQPLLQKSCYECHGPEKQKASLRVDSLQAMLKGGEDGPALIPGNSEKSPLIRRCLGLDDAPRMPFRRSPLPPEQIQLLRNWVDSLPASTTLPATQPQKP